MGDHTGIEWTDATWNPVRGCRRVSEGCRNCYAERVAARFAGEGQPYEGLVALGPQGPRWNGTVRLVPEMLEQPIRWRKPRRIFVNSMSDLFHEDVPDEYVLRVFDVMRQAGQHVFQVLTKRPDRMRDFCLRLRFDAGKLNERRGGLWLVGGPAIGEVERAPYLDELRPWHGFAARMRNVWLGVSVENQPAADERIPLLLDTPAANRFLSCEPLLGPDDLARWQLPPRPSWEADPPATWEGFPWPEWVPESVRSEIEKFWSLEYRRGPRDWSENGRPSYNNAPEFGERVTLGLGEADRYTGRYVHAWNNIGRLVLDDGSTRVVSTSGYEKRRRIDWVIVGGESGPGARPMHPAWARQLRDQCIAAGVPFFFKQWGDWAPFVNEAHYTHCGEEKHPHRWLTASGEGGVCWLIDDDGNWSNWTGTPPEDDPSTIVMGRHGKKYSGRELDGREWSQVPGEEVRDA